MCVCVLSIYVCMFVNLCSVCMFVRMCVCVCMYGVCFGDLFPLFSLLFFVLAGGDFFIDFFGGLWFF